MSAEQAHARHDFGECEIIQVESIGPPGERRFRLRADAETGSALLWLEKEELYELALTVKRLLRTGVHNAEALQAPDEDFLPATIEFQVQQLALGHDRATGRYLILAQISDDDGDAVALWARPEVLDQMADQAFAVHDAGRAKCPLCGAVMAAQKDHRCPRVN